MSQSSPRPEPLPPRANDEPRLAKRIPGRHRRGADPARRRSSSMPQPVRSRRAQLIRLEKFAAGALCSRRVGFRPGMEACGMNTPHRQIHLPANVTVSLRAGFVLAIANVLCVAILAWAWTHVSNTQGAHQRHRLGEAGDPIRSDRVGRQGLGEQRQIFRRATPCSRPASEQDHRISDVRADRPGPRSACRPSGSTKTSPATRRGTPPTRSPAMT